MIEYVEEMWLLATEGDKQGVLFFIAAYALIVCLYSFIRQHLIRQWPMTKGNLRSASVEKWGRADSTLSDQEYKVDALYDYQVSGNTYRGTRISPWIIIASHNARFLLRKQLEGIQRNADGTVDVLFNPNKPQKSYLIKPGLFGMAITLAIAVLPLLFYASEYAQT